jgi:molecular chaperone GrpE
MHKESQNVLRNNTIEEKKEIVCESAEVPARETSPVAGLDDVSGCAVNVQEQLHRLQADFANFRRRAANIAERSALDRAVEIVTLLLPVIDNLERALGTETTDAAYAAGMRLTYRHLMNTLTSIGLEPICAAGEAFDPHVHEAVMRVETDAVPEGTILEVFEKGYRLNGNLLRPAQVSVVVFSSSDSNG